MTTNFLAGWNLSSLSLVCQDRSATDQQSAHAFSRRDKQGTPEQSLKLNPGWHHTVAFSPIHLLMGGGGQHTQAVRGQQGRGGRAKSAHPPIGCRPVAQPRVTVTMSFCEQGRSSFVHFSGRQEHKRTPSAPSAVVPLVEAQGVHMQGHPGEAWRQHGRNRQAGKE